MNASHFTQLPGLDEAAAFAPVQVVNLCNELAAARQQIDWFKRQFFGQKSERRPQPVASAQMSLGELIAPVDRAQPAPTGACDITAHRRRTPAKRPDTDEDAASFFDETPVPARPAGQGGADGVAAGRGAFCQLGRGLSLSVLVES